ncbi:alpha/beta fold hydrolase [Photobacterium kasasachensis]|uniref:alpha/beta fold hydrolase n=1 Tax=Photobacterium kasasachensis TaxID=2910240 RepID=UPI003D0FAC80
MKNNKSYFYLIPIVALLNGCSDDSELETDSRQFVPYTLDKLYYPNDLLLSDSDGTIELPAEQDGSVVDYHDYENVYGALDGWSTGYPMTLPLVGSDIAIDPETLSESVILFDVASGQRLVAGEDFVTSLSESQDIVIKPMKIFPESTTYVLALTNGIRDIQGNELKPSPGYEKLAKGESLDDPLSDQAMAQVQRNQSQLKAAGVAGEIVYSAEFTTQSIYPVMEAARDNIPTQMLQNLALKAKGRDYWTYSATISIPYYLDMPASSNCEVSSLYERGSDKYQQIDADPVGYCPPLYSWWNDVNGNFVHGLNPEPAIRSVQEIPVIIYSPVNWNPIQLSGTADPLPTSIFVHGITGWKESAGTMVKSIVTQGNGRLVVAIDQPLHGERGIDLNNDGVIDITATSSEDNEDKSVYLNLLSPLTLRDNQRQAVLDQLALRKALNSTPYIDNTDISLIGHSLGGIISTMVSEMSQGVDELAFSTVTLVVPGMHLTDLVMNSMLLGEEVIGEIKKSTDVQLAVAGILGVYDESLHSPEEGLNALRDFKRVSQENRDKAAELEEMIYGMVIEEMTAAIQAAVDAGDPANFTTRQATNTEQPILLIEAAGNCGEFLGESCIEGVEYLSDTVVPNSAEGLPLAGTEPLIRHLDLDPISQSIEDGSEIIKGAVRVKHGGHGTYLFPYEGAVSYDGKDNNEGVPSLPGDDQFDMAEVKASMDMQQLAVSSFVTSGGVDVVVDENLVHGDTDPTAK